jgi:hypothetical protein
MSPVQHQLQQFVRSILCLSPTVKQVSDTPIRIRVRVRETSESSSVGEGAAGAAVDRESALCSADRGDRTGVTSYPSQPPCTSHNPSSRKLDLTNVTSRCMSIHRGEYVRLRWSIGGHAIMSLLPSLQRLNRYAGTGLRPTRGRAGPGNRGVAVEGATPAAKLLDYRDWHYVR